MGNTLRVASLVCCMLGGCAPAAKAPSGSQQERTSLRDSGDNQIIGLQFMSLRDGHGGPQYFPIDGDPIAGKPQLVELQLMKGASKVAVEVRDPNGTLVSSTPLERSRPPEWPDHTKHWAQMLKLPEAAVQLHVIGVLEDGQEFRTRSRYVEARSVQLEMLYVPSMIGGRPLDYEIKVQNFGPDDDFEVSITDDEHFLAAPVKQQLSLKSEETKTLTVTLNLPVAEPSGPNLEDHVFVTVTSTTRKTSASAYGSVPLLPGRDADADWVNDEVDNCPALTNPPQLDQDEDGMGDDCDPQPTKAAKKPKKKG